MRLSLVVSEMCIRDSFMKFFFGTPKAAKAPKTRPEVPAALTVEVTE